MPGDLDSESFIFVSPVQERTFNDIRAALPNFPASLIYHWLLPFAEDIGWPPRFDGDPAVENARWRKILQRPLFFWRTVTWRLEHLRPNQLSFTREALRDFHDMVKGHACGQPTLLTVLMGEGSRRRFFQQVHNNTSDRRIP